jgi:hypothetical protein
MSDVVQNAIDNLLPSVRAQMEASLRGLSVPQLQAKNRRLNEEVKQVRQNLSTDKGRRRAVTLAVEVALLEKEVFRRKL